MYRPSKLSMPRLFQGCLWLYLVQQILAETCEKAAEQATSNRETQFKRAIEKIDTKEKEELKSDKSCRMIRIGSVPVRKEVPDKEKQVELLKDKIDLITKQQTEHNANVEEVSAEHIENILKGSVTDRIPITAKQLYGQDDLEMDVQPSPCSWFKVTNEFAKKVKPDIEFEAKSHFIRAESETPVQSCAITKCFSQYIVEQKVRKGLGMMYRGFLSKLGLPQGSTEHERMEAAETLIETTCNKVLPDTGNWAGELQKNQFAGHIEVMGGCPHFCKYFTEEIVPLLAQSGVELQKRKREHENELELLKKDIEDTAAKITRCNDLNEQNTISYNEKKKSCEQYLKKKIDQKEKQEALKKLEEEKEESEKDKKALEEELQKLLEKLNHITKEGTDNKEKIAETTKGITDIEKQISQIDGSIADTTSQLEKLQKLGNILSSIRASTGDAAKAMTEIHEKKMLDMKNWLDRIPENRPLGPDDLMDVTDEIPLNLCDDAEIHLLQKCPWWIDDEGKKSHILVSPLQAALLSGKSNNLAELKKKLEGNNELGRRAEEDMFKKGFVKKGERQSEHKYDDEKVVMKYKEKLKPSLEGIHWEHKLQSYSLDISDVKGLGVKKYPQRTGAVDICNYATGGRVTKQSLMDPLEDEINHAFESVASTKDIRKKLNQGTETSSDEDQTETSSDEDQTETQLLKFKSVFQNIAGISESKCLDFEFYPWASEWRKGQKFEKLMALVLGTESTAALSKEKHEKLSVSLVMYVNQQKKLYLDLTKILNQLATQETDLEEAIRTVRGKIETRKNDLEKLVTDMKEMKQNLDEVQNQLNFLKGIQSLLQTVGKEELYQALHNNRHRLSERILQSMFLEKDAHKLTQMVKESLAKM
jgi:hypothetical protein